MTLDQRRVAAADMLVGARQTDGEKGLPGDALIADFERQVSTGCEASASQTISDVAIGVYLIDRSHWKR